MINSLRHRVRDNSAIYFGGTGEAYLIVDDTTTDATISSGEFTILVAVKSNSGHSGNRDIVGNWLATGNLRSFLLRFTSTDALQVFSSSNGSAGGAAVNATSTNTFTSTSDWYLIGISFSVSESVNADKCKLYVDGSSEALGTPSGTWPAPYSNSKDLVWGGRETITVNMDGYVSYCYVIDRPLTATEHSDLYNSGDYLYPPLAFPGDIITQPLMQTATWDGSNYSMLDNWDATNCTTSGIASGDLFQNAGPFDQ